MSPSKLAVILFLSFCFTLPLHAQDTKVLDKADKFYNIGLYPKAIKLYEGQLTLKKAPSKKATVPYARNLADAYKQNGDLKKAETWWSKLAKGNHVTEQDRLAYINLLRYKGKYVEAKKWAETWRGSMGEISEVERLIESCEFAIEGQQDKDRYKISKNTLSGPGADTWATPYDKGMLVSTTRKKTWKGTLPGGRRGSPLYDLYYAEAITGPKGWKFKKIKCKECKSLHEGPAAVSPDQDLLYFTSGNYYGGKRKKPKLDGFGTSKILVAIKSGKKWTDVEALPFNSDEYSCMHPALSPDGRTMVFASDIEGGLGGFDLYVSRLDEKGVWGSPTNLGGRINSKGNELYPSLTAEGALFYSSDGLVGFGGLDIFAATSEGDKWGNVKNAGFPLNSSRDDMGISVMKNRGRGTFSSNRPKGKGLDDIYTFSRKMGLEGVIVDSRTKEFLPGATVRIMDANNRNGNYTTDDAGKFIHYGDAGKEYFITVNAPGYIERKERINTQSVNPMDDYPFLIEIERELVMAVMGTVTDKESGKPLADAEVSLDLGNKRSDFPTSDDGSYKVELSENQDYTVIIAKKGYRPQTKIITTKGVPEPKEFHFDAALEPGIFFMLEGATISKGTRQPLGGVLVDAFKEDEKEPTLSLTTANNGKFWMFLDPADSDFIVASKDGYFPLRQDLPLATAPLKRDTLIPANLELVGSEVGAVVKTIYYDYNQSSIRKSAGRGLEEIVHFLNANPSISIELNSYTDSRGRSSYNLTLSQKRADAARNYLISKGIKKNRVTAKGRGETNLLNQCKDGVECSDEAHSANRRAEITITKIK